MTIDIKLLDKYNVPVPRYTSYPTVPYWEEKINKSDWEKSFLEQHQQDKGKEGISLYIHLPFCESLCTYCGCNKKITTNHSVEKEYIQTLLKEWDIYLQLMSSRPVIRELHLGGGTPTFFSPENLELLLNGIFTRSTIHDKHEFSFEGHPNNTTIEHLRTLFNLGFRRVSYGVQDHDIEVQRIINRIQPVESVKRATDNAREIGYRSVNFDLIYGLPLQNMQRMEKTIEQTIELNPDRIAFYSYAHVPWTSKGQRLFDENDLPSTSEKINLLQLGKKLFAENNYHNIGMDHFALPEDDLYVAWTQGRLHRNFMGYTTQHAAMMLGLGVSSISDTGSAFVQNEKTLHDYTASINKNVLATRKGYFLSEEDIAFRKYILDISCQGKTSFKDEHHTVLNKYTFPALEEMQTDGLINFDEHELTVTALGNNFTRNICSAFDLKLRASKENAVKFSKAI
ncbi:MAG: oxygen-independent coproporphyrinogen III oxidase [Bacteroidetes bacterium]|nr:oxygen-independent coproporphyrinogen III oxidase [Bacteroidota bacterium]